MGGATDGFYDKNIKIKKAGLHRPLPLRHIKDIVIWEGNYTLDINIFGKNV
jgi:hypothetical protein